jgi:uncharacterized protein YegP (UPF0339 family)
MASARFQLFSTGRLGVSWRFVASNNRVLAVGLGEAVDETTARHAVRFIQQGLDRARPIVSLDPGGRWRWRLVLDGSPVATSSREYFRRVECEATVSQFVVAGSGAPVSTSVARFPSTLGLREPWDGDRNGRLRVSSH